MHGTASLVGVKILLANDSGNDYPIYVSLRHPSEVTGESILNEYEKVVQSNEKFALRSNLIIEVDEILVMSGGEVEGSKLTYEQLH